MTPSERLLRRYVALVGLIVAATFGLEAPWIAATLLAAGVVVVIPAPAALRRSFFPIVGLLAFSFIVVASAALGRA